MFPDRVEVRSPGALPLELTIDDIVTLRATSVPRNEILAGFLRDIPGYMERVGSGIRFMVTQMREMSLPDPEFSDHLDFMVIFRNGQVVEEQNELNPRQVIGMQIVRERGSISTPEYCAATGATDRMGLRDLQDLVAKGLLERR
jgi:predicted HTH transcriptional regulator